MADGTANLIPAKPGEVRNPNGKPKGTRNRSTIVRELIEAILEGETVPEVDHMTQAVIKKAKSGDPVAWEKLMDSAYGKMKDVVETEISTKQDNDLTKAVLSKLSQEELEAILAREPQDNV